MAVRGRRFREKRRARTDEDRARFWSVFSQSPYSCFGKGSKVGKEGCGILLSHKAETGAKQ